MYLRCLCSGGERAQVSELEWCVRAELRDIEAGLQIEIALDLKLFSECLTEMFSGYLPCIEQKERIEYKVLMVHVKFLLLEN